MLIALVDDDNDWLRKASDYIQTSADKSLIPVELLCFNSGQELFSYTEKVINAVFMDIELEQGSGIDLVTKINDLWPNCQIVYCTEYMHYAMDVYGTKHAFFLSKSRIGDRIDHILKRLLRVWQMENMTLSFHVLKVGEKAFKVKDILYFERKTRQTILVTAHGHYNIKEKTLEIIKKLPEGDFTRCHACFTVNLSCIDRKNGSSFELINGESVPISRSFAEKTKSDYLHWCEDQMN